MPLARNVVLNALFLDPAASGGPETYLRGLAPALAEARPEARLTDVTTRQGAKALREAGWEEEGITVWELPCDEGQRVRRQLAEQVVLPRLARKLGADVLHNRASVAPIRVRDVAHVITLHDVNFVLCVGAKRPHKNQALLIRAMHELPVDIRLVLVGHPGSYEQSLRSLTHELRLQGRVVFTDWVSEEDLEGLWSLASVAAVPTLAEWFGLPLLEAMAHGVPVAASDLAVLREVGDSWPTHFDPGDPADAARAILAPLSDPPDPAIGRSLAARFTWTAAAEGTWAVYDLAVEHRARAGLLVASAGESLG